MKTYASSRSDVLQIPATHPRHVDIFGVKPQRMTQRMRFYLAAPVVALAACVSPNPDSDPQESSAPPDNIAQPAASAQSRVIGLISLPQVFGDQPCATYIPSEIGLYAGPDSSAPVGVIRVDQPSTTHPNGGCEGVRIAVEVEASDSTTGLPTLEYDYEMLAAVVLDQRGDWFRIRLAEGTAWIRRSADSRYLSLQELLVNGLTYIARTDGSGLGSVPGAGDRGIARDLITTGRSVRLLETRIVGGDLWLKIVVHDQSPCEATGEPTSAAEGWLPAHTQAGEPIVWFYSRGC